MNIKSIFIGILLLTFLVGSNRSLSSLALFELNRDFIAESLCINPEKACCKGSCYLNQQLSGAEEGSGKQVPILSLQLTEISFLSMESPVLNEIQFTSTPKWPLRKEQATDSGVSNGIWRPPPSPLFS